jgi:hypothetical protein
MFCGAKEAGGIYLPAPTCLRADTHRQRLRQAGNAVGRFPEPGDEELLAGPSSNFQLFDPLDFLAEVTQHIPDPGAHLVRTTGGLSAPSLRWTTWEKGWCVRKFHPQRFRSERSASGRWANAAGIGASGRTPTCKLFRSKRRMNQRHQGLGKGGSRIWFALRHPGLKVAVEASPHAWRLNALLTLPSGAGMIPS